MPRASDFVGIASYPARHPASIIGDTYFKFVSPSRNSEQNPCSAGMFEGVVHGFLHRQKNIVPDLGGKMTGRQLSRNAEFATNRAVLKELAGITANVIRQTLQRIILRIHRPYDLVQ